MPNAIPISLGELTPKATKSGIIPIITPISAITGRSTTLFRPPYAADTSPSSLNELFPLKIAQDLNYLVVLENIDPQDWARPGADIILRRIKQQRHDGSVILLHDA